MRYRVLCWAVVVGLLVCSLAYADIPKTINFQGRLTDASGKFVSDGNYSLTFKIYSDSSRGSSKWSETQTVAVSKGLFNATLGILTPIPDSIFNYVNTWLGIQVGADAEMTPRQRLSSLGYAYRGAKADTSNYSKDSDKLDGLHASDFSGIGTDYGRSGVATDLYEGVTTLTNKYVNVAGPDSVYSTSGTAFSGKVSGISVSNLVGVRGYADNTSTGEAYGGDFETSSSGIGSKTGVRGRGYGSSSAYTYGSSGYADNTSTGYAYGGYFSATASGTGVHTGVRGRGYGSSSSETYGASGYASNSSTGYAYGGFFETSTSGTGVHYGLRAEGYGTGAANTYGSYSYADNTSSGDAYAGYFATSTSGTGVHYGVKAESYGASSSPVHGLNGRAENTSSGYVYAGLFTTASSGTGGHYGIYSQSSGSSSSGTYGVLGTASNTSTGTVYGVHGTATNSSSGSTYGGNFTTSSSGTGNHEGVAGWGYSNGAGYALGVRGYAQNTYGGNAYGGHFTVSNLSNGQHFGIWAEAAGQWNYAGYFVGHVQVTEDFFVSGSKNAVVKVDNGEYRSVYCQESPEVWFEDFGEGQLVNGRTHIEIDPLFLQTVTINNQHPMKVFIQLNDENCKGTAVKRGTTGFDVIELLAGTSNASFSYRIVAKRKGYEDRRLAKFEGLTPEEMAVQSAKINADIEKNRVMMEQENQAVADQK